MALRDTYPEIHFEMAAAQLRRIQEREELLDRRRERRRARRRQLVRLVFRRRVRPSPR